MIKGRQGKSGKKAAKNIVAEGREYETVISSRFFIRLIVLFSILMYYISFVSKCLLYGTIKTHRSTHEEQKISAHPICCRNYTRQY